MATITELKTVLKDTLEKRGILGQIKARIRAEVFNALDDQNELRPPLSHENLLINELIREYLEFNKYKYAASVLVAESGQPDVPLDRDFLVKELNLVEEPSSRAVPLLYGIVAQLLQADQEGKVPPNFPRPSSSLQVSWWRYNKAAVQRSQTAAVPKAAHPGLEEPSALQGLPR
ncbi:centrosomal protein 20 isoform X1 [Paroedura picta]|uniref:centrosomal protein 20 isoform X1 n=1 Tax=Paroedura picta TaxID=143630 RepID=UPI004055F039